MVKIKSYFIYFVILIIINTIMMTLSSCTEYPVSHSENEYDSARFNWRTVLLPGKGYAGVWAKDTNRIYLLSHYDQRMSLLSNGVFTHYPFGYFYVCDIEGISENEIYIFGANYSGKLTIIKWNGAGFEYFETEFQAGPKNAIHGLVLNSNDIWMSTNGNILHFNGNYFKNFYYEDPESHAKELFVSKDNGKVQYITFTWNTTYQQSRLYEFKDTGFVKIFDEKVYSNYEHANFLGDINGFKYGKTYSRDENNIISISNFTGSGFIPYFRLGKEIQGLFGAVSADFGGAGTDMQNFIIPVETKRKTIFKNTGAGIMHWNGVKLSLEKSISRYITPIPFFASVNYNLNKDIYLFIMPRASGYNLDDSDMFIGTRK